VSFLELDSITSSYGASQSLFDVSLTVNPGEVVALMGRNGMGKSTTIKTICRMLPLNSGRLIFDGHDLSRMPSHKVAQLGIGLVPEGRRCFPNLTVEENLVAAARKGHWDLQSVARLFPRLSERRSQMSNSLSGGEQQMLAIGRALMTNPRLLILDEATEGLAPIVREEIWSAISVLKQQTELSIIVVDKSIRELSLVADTAVILERGSTVWSANMADLDRSVVDKYLSV